MIYKELRRTVILQEKKYYQKEHASGRSISKQGIAASMDMESAGLLKNSLF